LVSDWSSPGSTLKPFLYAMALDDGLIHAESLLQDVPRRFGDYRPGNFDTGFHGPVSASEALVRSLNLPAVQLLEAYGPKRFTANLRNGGLNLRFPLHSEPSLAVILGGTGSRLDQLVAAYSAFARGGMAATLRFEPQQ
ncbi:penicillin-binding transpeptidase domain-containing protein, partial [Yersinia mollaretii]|uniref:penicillin-binding transpeptidase domain-containing protein n=1 Tax=Yersinia mollaretii TaxID=33060 RepID=UPI0006708191